MIRLLSNIRLIVVLIVFGWLSHPTAEAQFKDYKYKFIGKVIAADSTAAPIKDCHVVNTTQRMGTISDESGNFTITANVKDSLEFSVIGFEKLKIVVADSMYTNTRIVRLKPATYELSEVNIGLLSTYERFKQDLLSKDIQKQPELNIDPINKFEIYTPPLPGQGGFGTSIGSPITFLYNLWSKEGKQQRHYLSIVNRTAEHIIIGEKFNGDIVKQLTGLENEELVAFMSSCFFTKEYLLYVSQVEINRDIMRKYREYVKNKEKKQQENNHLPNVNKP